MSNVQKSQIPRSNLRNAKLAPYQSCRVSDSRENKMGTVPVKKLLFTVSLPIMISMSIQSLYTMVDSMFVTSDAAIRSLGSVYLRICTCLSFGIFGQTILERFLISTGKTSFSMITQAAGAIVNMILDPVFIFGYFGIPKMGIAGAAIATVVGQCIAFFLALLFNFKYNQEVRIIIGKPVSSAAKQILTVGIPTSIMQILTSVMFILFNMILASFTTTAVAVFGVCRSITAFFYTLANGMCSAVVPVLAYNYGAGKRKRVRDTIKYGYIYITAIMATGMLLFLTLREFGVLIPVAYVFSRLHNLTMVWGAAPVADLVSSSLSVYLLYRVYQQKIRKMAD